MGGKKKKVLKILTPKASYFFFSSFFSSFFSFFIWGTSLKHF
jgi:hypothetical protein